MDFVVANQRANRGRHHQNLGGHHTPLSGAAWQQRLRDDALEHERELRAHLRLLMARKDVDDTIDRFSGGVRVQRGERQVTRLGNRERGLNRFEVAHFADEQHIRIFTQRVLQRVREALGIRADFALVDDAALMPVDELDRIFNGDDVAFALAVDLVDHGRQRRRFSGACGTRDEHEAARLLRHARDDRRQVEIAERLDADRDLTHDHRNAAALLEAVAAETRETLNAE
jgi:hypothetical protein